jgi:hypothetical protein
MAGGKNRRYSYQQYLGEAQIKPFDLELSDDKTVSIPVPDGDALLDIADNQANPRRVLRLLTGDHYQDVMAVFGPAPATALTALIQDMVTHFGISASPGDTGAPST